MQYTMGQIQVILAQHCNTGYDGGWKLTCAIGVAKFGTADGHCQWETK
jgi:hypothetical protein